MIIRTLVFVAAVAAAAPTPWEAGTAVTLGARLGKHTRAQSKASTPAAQALAARILNDFKRCDDVTRLMLAKGAIDEALKADHVSLGLQPVQLVELKVAEFTAPVSRLVVPLTPERTKPDWVFYCSTTHAATGTWGVYRWRKAPQDEIKAVRALAAKL